MASHVWDLSHPAGWSARYEHGFQAAGMGPSNSSNVFWGNRASSLQESTV